MHNSTFQMGSALQHPVRSLRACVRVCVHVRAPVRLRVNSLCLSDSSLKSVGCGVALQRGRDGRGSIPDITPVFNAPQRLDNRRSDLLLLVFLTKLIKTEG